MLSRTRIHKQEKWVRRLFLNEFQKPFLSNKLFKIQYMNVQEFNRFKFIFKCSYYQ